MARLSYIASSLNEKQTYNDLNILLRNNLREFSKTHRCTKSFLRDVKLYYNIIINQNLESLSLLNLNEETKKVLSNLIFCALKKISSNENSSDLNKLSNYGKEIFHCDIFKILLLLQNYFTEINLGNRRRLKSTSNEEENKTVNCDIHLNKIISLICLHFENNLTEEIKNIVLNLADNISFCNNGHGNALNEPSSGRFAVLENYVKLAEYFSNILHQTKICYVQYHQVPVLLPITTLLATGTADMSGNDRNKHILTSLLEKIDQTKDVAKSFSSQCISKDIDKFISACVELSENLKKVTELSENGQTSQCEEKCETCSCEQSEEENKEGSKCDAEKGNIEEDNIDNNMLEKDIVVNNNIESVDIQKDHIVKDDIQDYCKSESDAGKNIVGNNMKAEGSVGYFERETKTSKIKRFVKSDGTVREEIETTIVTEKIHDPDGDIVDIDRDDSKDLEEEASN